MNKSALESCRVEVVRDVKFWRRRLLTPEALAKLAKEMSVGSFSAADISGLWKIGLLRADLVCSEKQVKSKGLKRIVGWYEKDEFAYCDFRLIEHRATGYGSALQGSTEPTDLSLYFHPFRLYVLHHVERTLKICTSSMQFLNYEPGVLRVAQQLLDCDQHWTSSEQFGDRFNYWNQIVETAAVVEPLTFNVVYRDDEPASAGLPVCGSFDGSLSCMLESVGKDLLRAMRTDLAFAAWVLDENRSIQVLLRLIGWRQLSWPVGVNYLGR